MTTHTEQFTINRRVGWGEPITVTIECDPLASMPIKLGLAVQAACNTGAKLAGAKLAGADLLSFRADMWMTLSECGGLVEVLDLIAKLRAGQIDGLSYGQQSGFSCSGGSKAPCDAVHDNGALFYQDARDCSMSKSCHVTRTILPNNGSR